MQKLKRVAAWLIGTTVLACAGTWAWTLTTAGLEPASKRPLAILTLDFGLAALAWELWEKRQAARAAQAKPRKKKRRGLAVLLILTAMLLGLRSGLPEDERAQLTAMGLPEIAAQKEPGPEYSWPLGLGGALISGASVAALIWFWRRSREFRPAPPHIDEEEKA
jgi:membrane protease YdiL (CAAX protease family)